jgi:hypothetical protein
MIHSSCSISCLEVEGSEGASQGLPIPCLPWGEFALHPCCHHGKEQNSLCLADYLRFPRLGKRKQELLVGKKSKAIVVKDLGKTAYEGQFPTGGWETLSPTWSVYGHNW